MSLKLFQMTWTDMPGEASIPPSSSSHPVVATLLWEQRKHRGLKVY